LLLIIKRYIHWFHIFHVHDVTIVTWLFGCMTSYVLIFWRHHRHVTVCSDVGVRLKSSWIPRGIRYSIPNSCPNSWTPQRTHHPVMDQWKILKTYRRQGNRNRMQSDKRWIFAYWVSMNVLVWQAMIHLCIIIYNYEVRHSSLSSVADQGFFRAVISDFYLSH